MRLPRWRKATWALVIWNVLIVAWLAAGIGAVSDNCAGLVGQELDVCQGATAIGGTIGASLILFIWFLGFIVLSLIWLMSRPSRRHCPRCGNEVKKGLTICPNCQYEFGNAVTPAT